MVLTFSVIYIIFGSHAYEKPYQITVDNVEHCHAVYSEISENAKAYVAENYSRFVEVTTTAASCARLS